MKKPIEEWLDKSKSFSFKSYNIFYNQFGTGFDLIIIHGYPYNSYEWKDVVPLLSKRFRVTVFDLLGFGFSDKPENHYYSFEEYTDLLNKLVVHLRIEQAHIIAHDLGVSIGQELLATEKDWNLNFSIKSICFTNGNLFPDVYQPRLIQRLLSQTPSFVGSFLSKNISKKTVHKNIRKLYGKYSQPSDEFLEELWGILNFNNGKNISYLLGKLVFEKIKYQDRWTLAMKDTHIPLAYICGPADPNSGIEMGTTFEKRIPNGKLIWMDDAIGHWPMIEDKNAFCNQYFSWLREY
jgi:pimeloyl-ACP methyl ester carboxylesterase